MRSFIKYIFVLFLITQLSSCVYLRLLSVKGQLQDINKNLSISDKNSILIKFNKPKIFSKDIFFLLKKPPTLKEEGFVFEKQSFHKWDYVFVSQKNKKFNVKYRMFFNHQNKLKMVQISENLASLFTKDFIEKSLSAIGHAKVTSKTFSVVGKCNLKDERKRILKSDILNILGEANQKSKHDSKYIWTYLYLLKKPSDGSYAGSSLKSKMILHFNELEELSSIRLKFRHMKLRLDYHWQGN